MLKICDLRRFCSEKRPSFSFCIGLSLCAVQGGYREGAQRIKSFAFYPIPHISSMALFSFRHSVKTFSNKRVDPLRIARVGQTAAHLRYICRPQAARAVLRARLEGGCGYAAAQLAEHDAQKRKGRVCERFVIALPVEATNEERVALVREFAERLSHGVAGYVAAVHDCHGNDIKNPHAHFVFFDVQKKGGGRGRPKSTLGLARKYAIEKSAKLWADLHNEMMRDWGYGQDVLISHLSYSDRGIDQLPTIHEGAGSRAVSKTTRAAKSEWVHVDAGHSRAEANNIIRQINELKEARSEGTDRLGTDYEDHAAERKRSFAKQRECCGGNGEVDREDRPPFGEIRNSSEGYFGAPEAPWRAIAGRCGSAKWAAYQKPPFARFGARSVFCWVLNGGRIRRIYRDLVMLRDALLTDRVLDKSQEGGDGMPLGISHAIGRENITTRGHCR